MSTSTTPDTPLAGSAEIPLRELDPRSWAPGAACCACTARS